MCAYIKAHIKMQIWISMQLQLVLLCELCGQITSINNCS